MNINATRMFRRLGRAVNDAYAAVEADPGIKGTVSLSVTVGRDKEEPGLTVSAYKLASKIGDAEAHTGGRIDGQLTLDLDDEADETISGVTGEPEGAGGGSEAPAETGHEHVNGRRLLTLSEEPITEGQLVPAGDGR